MGCTKDIPIVVLPLTHKRTQNIIQKMNKNKEVRHLHSSNYMKNKGTKHVIEKKVLNLLSDKEFTIS